MPKRVNAVGSDFCALKDMLERALEIAWQNAVLSAIDNHIGSFIVYLERSQGIFCGLIDRNHTVPV